MCRKGESLAGMPAVCQTVENGGFAALVYPTRQTSGMAFFSAWRRCGARTRRTSSRSRAAFEFCGGMWRRSVSSGFRRGRVLWATSRRRRSGGQGGSHAVSGGAAGIQLRELHLKLTSRVWPAGEYIENSPAAVKDFDAQILGQNAHLRGGQGVVKNR